MRHLWPIPKVASASGFGQKGAATGAVRRVEWEQEGGRFGGSIICQIQSHFLGLICLHGSTQTCASNRPAVIFPNPKEASGEHTNHLFNGCPSQQLSNGDCDSLGAAGMLASVPQVSLSAVGYWWRAFFLAKWGDCKMNVATKTWKFQARTWDLTGDLELGQPFSTLVCHEGLQDNY